MNPKTKPTFTEDVQLLHMPWGHQIADESLNLVLLAFPDTDSRNPKSKQRLLATARYTDIIAMYQTLLDNNLATRQMRNVLATVINSGRLLGTAPMQEHLFQLGIVQRKPDGNGNYQVIYPTQPPTK